jgi:Ala-tRNA(Pro) deacylase
MPVETLKKFLDDRKVRYVSIKHSLAYTAQEIASSAHIQGKDIAKTVIVKIDDRMAMAVLPAHLKIDLNRFSEALGGRKVTLAEEHEFSERFPGCAPGAMPPFGNLYDMEVYVDPALSEDEDIAFNAGSHTELIRLRYKDFARLVTPRVISLAEA